MTTQELIALIVGISAGLAGLGYIARKFRDLVHVYDRLEKLLRPAAATVTRELEQNSGSSIKDQVTNLAALVQIVARELADHGEQSRAAMGIYRKALADQGIHLPVAPGEDGYGIEEHPQ